MPQLTSAPKKSNQKRLFESFKKKLELHQDLFCNMYAGDQLWLIDNNLESCRLIANAIEKRNLISIDPFTLSTPKHIKNAKLVPALLKTIFYWKSVFMDMHEEYLLWLNYETDKKIPLIIDIIRNRAVFDNLIKTQPEVRIGDVYVRMDGCHYVNLAGHEFNRADAQRAWFSYVVDKAPSEDDWICLVSSMKKDSKDLPMIDSARDLRFMDYKVNSRIRKRFSEFGIKIDEKIFTNNLNNIDALKKFGRIGI